MNELGYLRNIGSQVTLLQTQRKVELSFVEALWSIISPRQQQRVSNAVVYDVLLLMVYKINLPVQ